MFSPFLLTVPAASQFFGSTFQSGLGLQASSSAPGCTCSDGTTPNFGSFPPCQGGPPSGSSCPPPPGGMGGMGGMGGKGKGMMGMMGRGKGKGTMGGGGMAAASGQCASTEGVPTLDGGSSVSIVVSGSTRTITANGIPDHYVVPSQNPYCVQTISVELPLFPQVAATVTPVPTRGPIAYATNGVMIFGPQEGNSANAVEDTFFVPCAGHGSPTGQWHYHHPDIACMGTTDNPSLLVGYALDGFPIYGALSGSKAQADALLDECNGRYVNGQYQYHVRSVDQVDESAPYANADGSNNWNYVLGCYRGTPVNTRNSNAMPQTFAGRPAGKGRPAAATSATQTLRLPGVGFASTSTAQTSWPFEQSATRPSLSSSYSFAPSATASSNSYVSSGTPSFPSWPPASMSKPTWMSSMPSSFSSFTPSSSLSSSSLSSFGSSSLPSWFTSSATPSFFGTQPTSTGFSSGFPSWSAVGASSYRFGR